MLTSMYSGLDRTPKVWTLLQCALVYPNALLIYNALLYLQHLTLFTMSRTLITTPYSIYNEPYSYYNVLRSITTESGRIQLFAVIAMPSDLYNRLQSRSESR